MKVMFLGLFLLFTAFSSVSQELQSNGFSFTLGKGCSVVDTNKITTVAANAESEKTIILSVYIVPSVEKGADIFDAYSAPNEGGHFVAACLGTNKGVLMVSLGGMGSVQSAIPQLKSVLSSLNHNKA